MLIPKLISLSLSHTLHSVLEAVWFSKTETSRVRADNWTTFRVQHSIKHIQSVRVVGL